MTAAALKPPPVALALLALAAVYYFTQRRNPATGAARNPSLGTLFGGNRAGTASNNPAVRSYLVPTNNALRLPLASATQRAENPVNVISQGLSLVQGLLGLSNRTSGNSGNTIAAPQYYGGEIFRPADFVPNYTPDSAGEEAAQRYFLSNPDEFISNPPATFVYDGGYDPNAGWLDQQ